MKWNAKIWYLLQYFNKLQEFIAKHYKTVDYLLVDQWTVSAAMLVKQ
jgi:hypothetical protein